MFLSRLNAAADSDVTVLLRCTTVARADAVLEALIRAGTTAPVREVGNRARRLEVVRRLPAVLGPHTLDHSPGSAGPWDLARASDDPTVVVVRWSHLAGDARTCQEAVLDGLQHAGLLGADADRGCQCVRLPAGAQGPASPADAWGALRAQGESGVWDALRAALPATTPLLRPLRTALDTGAPTANTTDAAQATDAVALIAMDDVTTGHAPHHPPASRFAHVVSAVAAMSGQRRIGVTVDLRRHEPTLPGAGTAGNLSLVGWIVLPRRRPAPEPTHQRVQGLLRRRFWRQQLAVDAWLGDRSPERLADRCDLLIGGLAHRAPTTVTELWRDDGPVCAGCGRARRHLPPDIGVLAIPPALPPAGLTVGITRTAAHTTVSLRRVTLPGHSATAWLTTAAARWARGRTLHAGPVTHP